MGALINRLKSYYPDRIRLARNVAATGRKIRWITIWWNERILPLLLLLRLLPLRTPMRNCSTRICRREFPTICRRKQEPVPVWRRRRNARSRGGRETWAAARNRRASWWVVRSFTARRTKSATAATPPTPPSNRRTCPRSGAVTARRYYYYCCCYFYFYYYIHYIRLMSI